MAKLFYTLDEAAAKLRMSPDQVKELVAGGRLQEFRDRDRLVFKVDQVDILAHGDEEGAGVPLSGGSASGEIALASESGSAMNLESPKEQTGISIFDVDQTEEADPSAVTHVTESPVAPEIAMETASSGSGLLDLTREVDDTSLGQDLLEGVGAREGSTAAGSGAGATAAETESGPLFESAPAEAEAGGAPALMAAFAEPFDGPGSGLTGGLALGMIAVLGLTLTLTIFGLQSATGGKLVTMIGGNPMMWWGIAAGAVLVCGVIGWMLGRKG